MEFDKFQTGIDLSKFDPRYKVQTREFQNIWLANEPTVYHPTE